MQLLCTDREAHGQSCGHSHAVVLRLWLQTVPWGTCESTALSAAVTLSWGLRPCVFISAWWC